MTDCRLTIDRIFGTSSSNTLNFAVSSNYVAYIASGGVVVAKLDKSDGSLYHHQRFFCSKNNNATTNTHTGANSYLNMASSLQSTSTELEKDAFGIVKPQQPIVQLNSADSTATITSQLKDFQLGTQSGSNTPTNSPSKISTRMKIISTIAISPDERFLAIGETGIDPRILIFSLAPNSNDYPVLAISEHSFGVLALKFSPDSKYLLSVGENHDSFLYLWKLQNNGSSATIIGINKCTSQINGVIWIDDHIITYGIRHIKIWNFEENETKTRIQGKSVILGQFLNSNFVYATEVVGEENEVIAALFLTSIGDLCIYDFAKSSLELKHRFGSNDNTVDVILHNEFEKDKLWVGTNNGLKSFSLSELNTNPNQEYKCPSSPGKIKFTPRFTSIHQINQNYIIYLTSNEEIQIYETETAISKPLIDALSKSINGLKMTTSTNEIINWTKDGIIKKINSENFNLEPYAAVKVQDLTDRGISNYLNGMDISATGEIITGDVYGNFTIFDKTGTTTIYSTIAHEFAINELCYFKIQNVEFVVSIGRDRMIQIFAKHFAQEDDDSGKSEIIDQWSIYETLAEHKGNLLGLIYHDSKIYVSSADRTISIHKFNLDQGAISITKERTISFKSSPNSMTIFKEELIVSTNDKTIQLFNLKSYENTKTMKLHDDSNNYLLVENLQVSSQNLLICTCSDKSIRVFNFFNGKELSINWGHSEAIKALLLLPDNRLLSLSNNGCLFSWIFSNPNITEPTWNNKFISGIQTPPRVVRKLKKLPATSPINKQTRTSRLQSTPKLTPSRLNPSSKPNLSPSPLAQKINRSPRGNSPSSPVSGRSSPIGTRARSSALNDSKINVSNENKINIDELIHDLRLFEENISSYTMDEVKRVKKHINGLFNTEEEILQRYNANLIESLRGLK